MKPLLSKPAKLLTMVCIYAMLLTQTGCLLAAAAAGTGATVAYVSGDLNTSVDAAPNRVAAATEAAMKNLELRIISNESSSVDARIVARTATDKKLTVTAKASGSNSSQLSVRAGTFGDDALQARLLEEIKKELALRPAVVSSPSTQPTASTGH